MEKLTRLLDSVDAAYLGAAEPDRDIASLLLLASLNVSQRLKPLPDALHAGSKRRPRVPAPLQSSTQIPPEATGSSAARMPDAEIA